MRADGSNQQPLLPDDVLDELGVGYGSSATHVERALHLLSLRPL
jgi:hypothetical protein